MKSDSLKTKDLIHVGVYTAIYIVVFFTVGMINAIPFLYPLLFILVPLITGIPFMLFLTKVEKFGMVSIMAVIIGIFWYIMGYTWIPTVSFIVLGLISDFVIKVQHEYSWICNFFLQYAGASCTDVADDRDLYGRCSRSYG